MYNSAVATAAYTIKPNAPTITAEGSEVTITGDAGCTFYYTTDGNDPTNASTQYNAPFDWTQSCLIKAIAYDAYGNASNVKGYQFYYFPLHPKNINSGYYEKVTDADDLDDGDAILIVNEEARVAMSTTQNTNNRGQAAVSFAEENVIYAPSAEVQKLVIAKQTADNTDVFYFSTGEGYLFAAASNKNYLRTEDVPDDNNNARATIAISNGNATIQFTGTNSRNVMQYNSNNSLFSCYGYSPESDASALQIYKEVAHNIPASVTSAEYATFNSKYALDFSESGITPCTATDNGSSVKLHPITSGKVPANTPVVLYKQGGGSADVPVIPSADAVSDNELQVVGEGGLSNASNIYVLAKPEGYRVGFYLWDSTKPLNAGKVYLESTSGARGFLPFDDATSIDDVKAETTADNICYDLQGRRVTKAQKGLYIVNGKKVLVK